MPVASADAVCEGRSFADEVVCLQTPAFFYAVGQFYRLFPQVDDAEVVALLRPLPGNPAASPDIPSDSTRLRYAMPAKILLFHQEAREKVCAGLNMLANAVKVTLGPKGRLVMLERSYGAPTVINSGVIVAREIELEDPFENLGARMAREVAAKTSETAGDGTTTATVLAQAIVNEGMKYVAAGLDPLEIKRGIDSAVEAVVAELGRSARPAAGGNRACRDDLGQR